MKIRIKQDVSQTEKFFWNMVGSMCNALTSMLLLLFINRISGEKDGGIFSLTYAIAQMMLFIGTFEVRNYQASDVKEKFELNDYVTFRIITCIVMGIISCGYAMLYSDDQKIILITILICLAKMFDAFSDVFQGMFQQRGRIDLSGKILSFRTVVSMITFVCALLVSKKLETACVVMLIAAIVNCFVCDFPMVRQTIDNGIKLSLKKCRKLFLECFPLFISAFLTIYIINKPKYVLNNYYDFESQNIFGIIFMPAFVINLFSMFIFYPMLTDLAYAWEEKRAKEFWKIIRKSLGWISLLTVVCLAGAYLLGIPVLSLLYGVDLKAYKASLLIIILGGSFNALSTMLRYVLTVMRTQKMILAGYIIAFIIVLAAMPPMIKHFAIWGASIAYLFAMTILSIVFALIMFIGIKKNKLSKKF